MKKVIINVLLFLMCAACSSGGDPVEDAKKYCDCYSKAVASGKHSVNSAVSLCQDLQIKFGMKYKNDPVKFAKFNQGIYECMFGGLLKIIG